MSETPCRSTRSKSRRWQAVLCTAAALSAFGCTAPTGEAPAPSTSAGIVAALSLGPDGVSYADVGLEDHEAWGPSALRAADDGTFWIADAAADRLLHLDARGQILGTLSIGEQVVGARDVLVRAGDLWVLDGSAMWPHVVRYSLSGQVLEDVAIPGTAESMVDGFLPSPDGRVLLHAGGVVVFELADGKVSEAAQPYALRDQTFDLAFPDAEGDDIGQALDIDTGRGVLHMEHTHFISSVRLLRVLSNGESFFSIEEVAFDPQVLVDATAVHLDADGNVLGRARLPVADQFLFVEHAATVDVEGRLYTLHTDEDGAQIARVAWQLDLDPVLDERIALARAQRSTDDESAEVVPPILGVDAGVGATAQALVTECRSTQTMMDTGFDYVNSATWVSTRNMDRGNTRCDGRGVPRYFEYKKTTPDLNGSPVCQGDAPGAGYECIRSVPYDWGGSDTVGMYRSAMRKKHQAGDIDTKNPVAENAGSNGIESCSHGVDCSGFVTRAWYIPGYYNVSRATTRTLSKYSTSISSGTTSHPECTRGKKMPNAIAAQAPEITTQCKNTNVKIQSGDILLKPGTHVTMFRKFGNAENRNVDNKSSTGKFPFHFEATKSKSFDRVSYFHWPWSRFDTYEPRRFKQVCP